MANPHLEVLIIGRSKGPSLTCVASYIYGKTLHDSRENKTHRYDRDDILFRHIFQPRGAPDDFYDLQYLCDKMEEAEKRRDARTARHFICSLPNELPLHELSRIVKTYIETNFVACGLCAIAAIHEGKNEANPSRNNPHAHIIVSTRTVGPEGFSLKKNREHDRRMYINIWREQWSMVQNRAYERNSLDIRVSLKSLKDQGVRDREPTIHLNRTDWRLEQRGEHTPAGDRKHAIKERNAERERQRQLEYERELELSR